MSIMESKPETAQRRSSRNCMRISGEKCIRNLCKPAFDQHCILRTFYYGRERRVLLVERLHRGEARGIPRAMTLFFLSFLFYNLLFSVRLSFERERAREEAKRRDFSKGL
jgi:hypothetical protein